MKSDLHRLVKASTERDRFFCLNYDFDFHEYFISPFYLPEVCTEDNQVTVAVAYKGLLAVFATEDRKLTLPRVWPPSFQPSTTLTP